MSDAQGSYKLDEAQAVLRETKAIKKAITCGEKEKQDLIKVCKFLLMWVPSSFLLSIPVCQSYAGYFHMVHTSLSSHYQSSWGFGSIS